MNSATALFATVWAVILGIFAVIAGIIAAVRWTIHWAPAIIISLAAAALVFAICWLAVPDIWNGITKPFREES